MENHTPNRTGLGSFEQDDAIQLLRVIGQQLDRNIFPLVKNGGLVVPNPGPTDQQNPIEVKQNERQGQRRSETGSRQRAARWTWQTYRSWKARQTPSIISQHLREVYEQQIEEVRIAYPGVKIWQQPEELWLITESSILPGPWHRAAFVTQLSYVFPFIARSWGFWVSGTSPKPVWIGPRHTNFTDSSICAFERSDQTWCAGQSVVELLDLYTVWALRHRHLEIFGRWPGRQTAHFTYERLLELNPDEYCGCGCGKLYADCCRESDLSIDIGTAALDFIDGTGGGRRLPPVAIVDFINDHNSSQCMPPSL